MSLRSSSIWTFAHQMWSICSFGITHFTIGFRIMHELHKFKLLVYFVAEFSVSCVISYLVDTTSPKPYQEIILNSIVCTCFNYSGKMRRFQELFLCWKDLRRTFGYARYVLKPVTRALRECIISYSLILRNCCQLFFMLIFWEEYWTNSFDI